MNHKSVHMPAVNTKENIVTNVTINIGENIVKPGDKVYFKNFEMVFVGVFSINGKKLPNILICSWHDEITNKSTENTFNITDLTIKPLGL